MTRAYAAFAFLCVVFGTTFGAIAIGIADGWPPLLSAALRFTIGGALVLAFARFRGELVRPERSHVRGIVSIGLSVTTGTFAALYCAERVLPSGLAAVLSASSPLFAVALALATKNRRLDAFAIGGLALGTIGVGLVAGVGAIAGNVALLASLAIVFSEIGYAWGLSQARAVSRAVPMLQLAGSQQLFGGCVLFLLSLVFEHRGPAHIDATGLLALGYLIVVASAGAHSISIWLASETNATFAASWTYVSPFIALLFGAGFLHEPIGIYAWIGGGLVVLGAFALNRDVGSTRARTST